MNSFLDSLSENTLVALPWIFDLWALPHQIPPEEKWRQWVIMGGRGCGKTRAGAEWVRRLVEGATPDAPGAYRNIALIGETYDETREVMLFGKSGLMSVSPPDRRPEWIASRKMLVWPNGAQAQIFSASEPESLRGPQFDAAWIDEFAKWKKAEEAWDMLQFCLRLGKDPRVLITTTPRDVEIFHKILDDKMTVVTRAHTSENAHHLAPGFLDALLTRYAGTRLGRQEIEGEFVAQIDDALWSMDKISQIKTKPLPSYDRVVVAVDPPASHHAHSDACGIVVAGALYPDRDPRSWMVHVLADLSVHAMRPEDWAARVIAAYHDHDADCVLVETNQGGDMVKSVLRQVDPHVKIITRHASIKKQARAEPVSALYAQGRVRHCGIFKELENEMILMGPLGYAGKGSPDRLDALVWAVHELVLTKQSNQRTPALRFL